MGDSASRLRVQLSNKRKTLGLSRGLSLSLSLGLALGRQPMSWLVIGALLLLGAGPLAQAQTAPSAVSKAVSEAQTNVASPDTEGAAIDRQVSVPGKRREKRAALNRALGKEGQESCTSDADPGCAVDTEFGGKGTPGGPLQRERALEAGRRKLRKTWGEAKNTIPTVTLNDKAKAMQGYAIAPVEGGGFVHLLNPEGAVVKTWPLDVDRVRLLPNCHILVLHGSAWGLKNPRWLPKAEHVTEYDWEGKVAWEYQVGRRAHHDVTRLPNGNTLFLAKEVVASKTFGGRGAKEGFPQHYESSEILEVSPSKEIVWRWSAAKHLDAADCGMRKCSERIDFTPKSKLFEWTHANTVTVIPPNRWHAAGDERFRPGNLIFMPRNFWKFYVIDKQSGDIVWSYGGENDGGIGPAHEPHMIPEGLPGAGNILFFSNSSRSRPENSQVWEIDPHTRQIVWRYEDGENLFSSRSGSVQRLPNGNTLISVDKAGRAIEVTPSGEKVWELTSAQEFNRVYKYPVGYCRHLS